MRTRHTAAAAVASLFAALALAAPATAAPTWAPAGSATIKPGVQTFTDGAQCTANFVYADAADKLYLGQAAHCSGTDGNTATNGCQAGSRPLGTQVEIDGASRPGTLAYNSWLTMQRVGETNQNVCRGNDFALIAIDPADYDKVNPSIPFWGGPTGVTDTTTTGDKVLSYGNSGLRGGIALLSPKEGASLGQSNGGWTHNVYTVTPGVPGDSGSAFIDGEGKAFGVLSVLEALPRPASNGVADVSRGLAYAAQKDGLSVQVAQGTEEFTGGLLP